MERLGLQHEHQSAVMLIRNSVYEAYSQAISEGPASKMLDKAELDIAKTYGIMRQALATCYYTEVPGSPPLIHSDHVEPTNLVGHTEIPG